MREGDKAALAYFYNCYFKLLYNYGRKIGIHAELVEDAIHDVFVDLWRYRKNLSSTTSVRFYLYRSLKRRVVKNMPNIHPFSGDKVIFEDLYQGSTPSLEHKIIEDETALQRLHRLKQLLNDLAPRQYEALVLYFYDELSFEEIGAVLNINEQSARNLMQRGLMQLKQFAKHVISLGFFLTQSILTIVDPVNSWIFLSIRD